MKYASPDRALAICDRCARTTRLSRLTNQIINQKKSGIMVCSGCLDIDQEQLQLGKVDANDAISLRNPRPDASNGRLSGITIGQQDGFAITQQDGSSLIMEQ